MRTGKPRIGDWVAHRSCEDGVQWLVVDTFNDDNSVEVERRNPQTGGLERSAFLARVMVVVRRAA